MKRFATLHGYATLKSPNTAISKGKFQKPRVVIQPWSRAAGVDRNERLKIENKIATLLKEEKKHTLEQLLISAQGCDWGCD